MEAAETPEAKLAAATSYLELYGERPGEPSDRAAAFFRDGKVRERDRQMNNRFASNMSKPTEADDPETYALAWKAMEAEKVGMLKPAAELWSKVKARFPDEAKLPYTLKEDILAKARWGWLADKRLADLKKVEELVATLRLKIADNHKFEVPFTVDPTSPEGLAIRGFRLEDFDDREKALRACWDQLSAFTEKESDKRDWYLLANQQRLATQKAPDDPGQARIARIKKKLDEADKVAEAVKNNTDQKLKRAEVRGICREVIDLYDDETEPAVKEQVKRAREIAAKVPKA
jgi:hypothetical protein